MILWTSICENDKFLLNCIKNFYKTEILVKMCSCIAGLYSVFLSVMFYCTDLFRRRVCLLCIVHVMMENLFPWLSPAGNDGKGSQIFVVPQKLLSDFLVQLNQLKPTKISVITEADSFLGKEWEKISFPS